MVVDAVAGNKELLNKYQQVFQAYKQLQQVLEQLEQQAIKSNNDFDYNQFQYNQLVELKPEQIDQGQLEEEYQMLTNTGEIQQNTGIVLQLLDENEVNAIQILKQSRQVLEQTSRYFHKAKDYAARIEPMLIELKDLVQELNHDASQLDYQPERITELKARLDQLYSLMQKNQVKTVDELIEIKNEFEQKLNQTSDISTQIDKTKKELIELEQQLTNLAQQLTQKRHQIADKLSNQIVENLAGLGMPNAQLRIQITSNSHFSASGTDLVNFMFTANKNQELQNISKIASGGEISRLMLSVKSVLSHSAELPTIIFDEIDTGVSGEIAHKMAELMSQMAKKMQVISITHLPQIAAKGKTQYKFIKPNPNKV
jgi:DNA repair protein RecN (Recombination protein N)